LGICCQPSEEKQQETLHLIEQIGKTYKKVNQLRAKLEETPRSKKPLYRRASWNLGRVPVQLSRLVRSLELSNSEMLRLVGLMKETLEQVRPREIRVEQTRTQSRPYEEGVMATPRAPLLVDDCGPV
jgi:hypothetical protein